MESSHQTRKIIGRILLLGMLLGLGWSFWAQRTSGLVQKLVMRDNQPLEITLGTRPAMLIAYTPSSRKAFITLTPVEETCQANKKRCIPHMPKDYRFFTPKSEAQDAFWEDFKYTLTNWRYNPLLAGRVLWGYITAWHERRTNLSPAEFILLSKELSLLETNDFTVKLIQPKKKKSRKSQAEPDGIPAPVKDMAPLALQDRPIIVEILNASGKRGLAAELTQYLRDKNQKGILRVDVLQYDNYPTQEETSWLEDYTGRVVQLKQLGNAIGINSEIRAGTAPNVICDTRIIIGKDFTMPL